MTQSEPNPADHASIKAWFDTWSGYVAAVDFDSARPMFEEDVVGFGTWMDTVEGLDNLMEKQWKSIWPTIRDFEFLTDTLQVRVSPDRLFAVAVLVWKSTGFHENGDATRWDVYHPIATSSHLTPWPQYKTQCYPRSLVSVGPRLP